MVVMLSFRSLFGFQVLERVWKERARGCVVNSNVTQNGLSDWACRIRRSVRAATIAESTFNHEVGAFDIGVAWFRVGAVGGGVSGSAGATNSKALALRRYVTEGVAVEAVYRLGAVLLGTMQVTAEGQPERDCPVGSLRIPEVND
jgi:hypothetical protein